MRKIFPGYDARSPTLSQPSPIGGDCLGPEFAKWNSCYVDRRALIFSGDLVRMWLRYADGAVIAIIKELHTTRDGRWWGRCADGVFQIGAVGQARTPVQPYFVEKIVALSEEQFAPRRSRSPMRRRPYSRRSYGLGRSRPARPKLEMLPFVARKSNDDALVVLSSL